MNKIVALGSVLLFTSAGLANANTVRNFTGTECASWQEVNADKLFRNTNGCEYHTDVCYSSGGGGEVALPIVGSGDSVDYDAIDVRYEDNTSKFEAACYVAVKNASGTVYTSTSIFSGIAHQTTSGSYDTFSWSTTTLPNSGNNISNVHVQYVYCNIPPKLFYNGSSCGVDASSYSTIRNVRVDTVNP